MIFLHTEIIQLNSKEEMLYCVNLNFARRFVILQKSFVFFLVYLLFVLFPSFRPILLHGERLIGMYLLRLYPFFVGSLGSRSIIGFPPRKTPRFNEYYLRTRYPARDVYCARHELSLPIIPASHSSVTVETTLIVDHQIRKFADLFHV